jgi:hypothetical protein
MSTSYVHHSVSTVKCKSGYIAVRGSCLEQVSTNSQISLFYLRFLGTVKSNEFGRIWMKMLVNVVTKLFNFLGQPVYIPIQVNGNKYQNK